MIGMLVAPQVADRRLRTDCADAIASSWMCVIPGRQIFLVLKKVDASRSYPSNDGDLLTEVLVLTSEGTQGWIWTDWVEELQS